MIEAKEESKPTEAAKHEVAPAELPKFARYIDGELLIDLSCTYFVGLFADQLEEKTMWYLQEFDDATELQTEMHLLRDMTVEIVKNTLQIDDSDFDLPVAVGQNDVPAEKVRAFAQYMQVPFEAKEGHSYEVSFLAEPE
ncbi:MAG: hypothetical protein V7694_10905 [Rhodococcus sp. (in: high G+C Gram-positive bacteria)]